MDDEELRELEDPDTWEEHGEILPPVDAPRPVLAVRLSIDDLELVEESARRRGMNVIEFMRFAAIEYARDDAALSMAAAAGGMSARDTSATK